MNQAVKDALAWIDTANKALVATPFSLNGAFVGSPIKGVRMRLEASKWGGASDDPVLVFTEHIVAPEMLSTAMIIHEVMSTEFKLCLLEVFHAQRKRIEAMVAESLLKTAVSQVAMQMAKDFVKLDLPKSPDVDIFVKKIAHEVPYISVAIKLDPQPQAGLMSPKDVHELMGGPYTPPTVPSNPSKYAPCTVGSLKEMGLVEGKEPGTVVPDPEWKGNHLSAVEIVGMLPIGITYLPHGEPKCYPPLKDTPKPPRCLLDD